MTISQRLLAFALALALIPAHAASQTVARSQAPSEADQTATAKSIIASRGVGAQATVTVEMRTGATFGVLAALSVVAAMRIAASS